MYLMVAGTHLIRLVSYHYIPFSEPIQRGRPREIGVALVRNSEWPYVRASLVPKRTH